MRFARANAPSFATARRVARDAALQQMRDAGRTAPDTQDEEFFVREFARLLWHVPYRQGGFCHGDVKQVRARARRLGLCRHIAGALFSPPRDALK